MGYGVIDISGRSKELQAIADEVRAGFRASDWFFAEDQMRRRPDAKELSPEELHAWIEVAAYFLWMQRGGNDELAIMKEAKERFRSRHSKSSKAA